MHKLYKFVGAYVAFRLAGEMQWARLLDKLLNLAFRSGDCCIKY